LPKKKVKKGGWRGPIRESVRIGVCLRVWY
jgi:hypothetical protein